MKTLASFVTIVLYFIAALASGGVIYHTAMTIMVYVSVHESVAEAESGMEAAGAQIGGVFALQFHFAQMPRYLLVAVLAFGFAALIQFVGRMLELQQQNIRRLSAHLATTKSIDERQYDICDRLDLLRKPEIQKVL